MIWFTLLALVACDGGNSSETGNEDSASSVDYPISGFGELAGSGCGALDEALSGTSPDLLDFTLTFEADASYDYDALTAEGQAIHDAGNLGGTSLYSEVMAFETLARCQGVELVKTEAEIIYETEGKKTDLLVTLDGTALGVSVTRAFKYPPGTPLEVADATALLEDKLADIQESTANVAAEDAWERQVLAVMAWDATAASSLQTAFDGLSAGVKADTIVWVAVTEGSDEWIYVDGE